MAKFRGSMRQLIDADESAEVLAQHDGLMQLLTEYESTTFDAWAGGLEETSAAKLRQPLLVRDETSRLLSVNFDPELVRLLREAFYLQQISEREIPAAAAQLSKQRISVVAQVNYHARVALGGTENFLRKLWLACQRLVRAVH